mmetsp:Transcript_13647/g.31430  ORF Transcript_13647/g.31430 Transcript_13647/m.31430 type:complete len:466 (+) Transcript_13647:136-1533(+)
MLLDDLNASFGDAELHLRSMSSTSASSSDSPTVHFGRQEPGSFQIVNGKSPKLCDFWSRNGNCVHGEHCRFLHDPSVAPRPLQVDIRSKRSRPNVQSLLQLHKGNDNDPLKLDSGPQNNSLSVTSSSNVISANDPRPFSKKKQRICDFFLKYGNCRQQEACRFLHLRLEDVLQQNTLQVAAPDQQSHAFIEMSQRNSVFRPIDAHPNPHGGSTAGSELQPLPDLIRCDDEEMSQGSFSQSQPFRHQLVENHTEHTLGLAGQRLAFGSRENGSAAFNLELRSNRGDGFMHFCTREPQQHSYESTFGASPGPMASFPSSQLPLPDTFTDSDFHQSLVQDFSALGGRPTTALQTDETIPSISLWAEEPRVPRNTQARGTASKPSYVPGVARAMDGSMWLVSPDGWAMLSEASNLSTMNVGRRRLCDFFCKHGNCRHGLSCSFLHVMESMPVEDYIEARTRKMDLSTFQ